MTLISKEQALAALEREAKIAEENAETFGSSPQLFGVAHGIEQAMETISDLPELDAGVALEWDKQEQPRPFLPEWVAVVNDTALVVHYGFQNSWTLSVRGEAESSPDDADDTIALVFGDSPEACMEAGNRVGNAILAVLSAPSVEPEPINTIAEAEKYRLDLERVTTDRDEIGARMLEMVNKVCAERDHLRAVIEEAQSWVEEIGYNATTLHGLKAILSGAKEQ